LSGLCSGCVRLSIIAINGQNVFVGVVQVLDLVVEAVLRLLLWWPPATMRLEGVLSLAINAIKQKFRDCLSGDEGVLICNLESSKG
jgi:hypothetical protein